MLRPIEHIHPTTECSTACSVLSNRLGADAISQLGRPAIIGIHGIPGSGTTFVRNAPQRFHGKNCLFIQGSDVITRIVPGGLEAFETLDEDQKRSIREQALRTIVADCLSDGKIGEHYLN